MTTGRRSLQLLHAIGGVHLYVGGCRHVASVVYGARHNLIYTAPEVVCCMADVMSSTPFSSCVMW